MTRSLDPGPKLSWRILQYGRLLGLAAAVLGLDQLTKAWIAASLPYGSYGEAGGALTVVPGFLYIVHVGNTGAAWSSFTGRSAPLAILAAATLAGIFLWRKALGLADPKTQTSFGLLCGGIAGNLADRIARGHVVDFLDFHFGSYTYPSFNVADSAICIGVVLYAWSSLKSPKSPI
jgi:signal peptidase II